MPAQPNDTATAAHAPECALRLRVTGSVQGVGFRPFVYNLATGLSLNGYVSNTPQGVDIDVEGPREHICQFAQRLRSERPAHSQIESQVQTWHDPAGYGKFTIRSSNNTGPKSATVLPDLATCDACLHEVFDPSNRRYQYPFTNCTHCGPRFSIIDALPYDRPNTSMNSFTMCPACAREYHDPTDRRFHAQPNACPQCGPQLAMWSKDGQVLARRDAAITYAVAALHCGYVVAVKGLGGFHLLVSATDARSVRQLRNRKHREEKPFAIMAPNARWVEHACYLAYEESDLLQSPASPIVLLHPNPEHCEVTSEVCGDSPYLGVMLPYTPLHHLLLRGVGGPLVATSGNLADEPICTDEREALDRLDGVADLYLVHDRPIVRPVDDSVVQVVCSTPQVLRRARGYAPLPVRVPETSETVLATGGHLKNTVALAKADKVYLSQHIGDLVETRSQQAFTAGIDSLCKLYEGEPTRVACDLHPDYVSTRFAYDQDSDVIPVQHHFAHVVACMAEHHITDSVLGISWDGSGYGPDHTVWGGEFLSATLDDYERVAHFRTFPLPGGEAAVMEPRRSALGVLYSIFGHDVLQEAELPTIEAFRPLERAVLETMLAKDLNSPKTSSAGRLFDAAASILGLSQRSAFEGQAAMRLETAARQHDGQAQPYTYRIREEDGMLVVDWRALFEVFVAEVRYPKETSTIAARFHATLTAIIVDIAKRAGIERVVLTGGCFQNRLLTECTVAALREQGFQTYWHQQVPPNDGGLALGQAVHAGRRQFTGEQPCV